MMSPRVVSSPATETIRWKDVIGLASQAPNLFCGSSQRFLDAVTSGLVTSGPVESGAAGATADSGCSAVESPASSAAAPRRLSRDQRAATGLPSRDSGPDRLGEGVTPVGITRELVERSPRRCEQDCVTGAR